MFVLKLEFLQLISKWLDGIIRRMIVEIQISQLPRETLKIEQESDNIYNIRNVPLCHLTEFLALAQEIEAQGLAPANTRDFIETLENQIQKILDRTYGARS